jgi:hypothetical protein
LTLVGNLFYNLYTVDFTGNVPIEILAEGIKAQSKRGINEVFKNAVLLVKIVSGVAL